MSACGGTCEGFREASQLKAKVRILTAMVLRLDKRLAEIAPRPATPSPSSSLCENEKLGDENERCHTCMFFMGDSAHSGECRRGLPTMYAIPWGVDAMHGSHGVWPTVGQFDWCGEWKQTEWVDE